MKPFALMLAMFWSVQALVCLPLEFSNWVEGRTAQDESGVVGHHHESENVDRGVDSGLARESAHHSSSNGTESDHHQDSDGQCARHCASLNQSIVATSPTILIPDSGSDVLISILVNDKNSTQLLARKIDAFEIGLPPPDLLTLHRALRI